MSRKLSSRIRNLMTMDRSSQQSTTTTVLSIECLKGTSKADEWTADMLQTGDIVEEIKIGSYLSVRSPFKDGKTAVQKILHTSFRNKDTSITVRVRRVPNETVELQACIVPNESAGRKNYMLRAIADPNYAVGFSDRTESECFALQASRNSRMVSELTRTKLQDGYVSYPWERRMQEVLPIPTSSSFLSLLLLPKASDPAVSRYNDLDDTLARANAWLNASQASGVPVVFMSIQTESLLTKISGETASSTVNAGSLSDLSNLTNTSMYGFEDYHGVDLGVVRAVRLWYAPLAGEVPIEIKLKDDDSKLGFAISRTDEGFVYISSVIDGDENAPSTRSGLRDLYNEATKASRLLVVSRISNEKVLPWMVSSTGAIRCFDTVSLSQKISLHKHAKVTIILHLFMWDRSLPSPSAAVPHKVVAKARAASPPAMEYPPEVHLAKQPKEKQVHPLALHDEFETNEYDEEEDEISQAPVTMTRDTAGENSFRFHEFSFANNWELEAMDPPSHTEAPLLSRGPTPIQDFLSSCLWFICCCGVFANCCPPLFEPVPSHH